MSCPEYDQAAAVCSPRTPRNTKRITRVDTATDDHVIVTASRSSELRRLRHTESSPRAMTPNRSRSSSRHESVSSLHYQVEQQRRCQERADSPSVADHQSGLTSPRPYSHVRSVVRDLIERNITPLEARYGHAVRYQSTPARGDSRSKRSSSVCGITPIGEARQGGRTPRGLRVPSNHVPRCAESVPERYKHQPKAQEPKLSPFVFGRGRSERSMSCGGGVDMSARRSSTPSRSIITVAGSLRESTASGIIRPSRSVSSATGGSSALEACRRRQPVGASRSSTPSRSQRVSALPKVQQGVERALLFDTAPPRLSA